LFTHVYGSDFDSIEDIEKFFTKNQNVIATSMVPGEDGNLYFNAQSRVQMVRGMSYHMTNHAKMMAGQTLEKKDLDVLEKFIPSLRQSFQDKLISENYDASDVNRRAMVSEDSVYFSLTKLLQAMSSFKPSEVDEAVQTTMLDLPSLNPNSNKYVNSDYSWTSREARIAQRTDLSEKHVDLAA
jgi:hypothetical protein